MTSMWISSASVSKESSRTGTVEFGARILISRGVAPENITSMGKAAGEPSSSSVGCIR